MTSYMISVSFEVSCADATAAQSTCRMAIEANIMSIEMNLDRLGLHFTVPWRLLIVLLEQGSTRAPSTAIYPVASPVSDGGRLGCMSRLRVHPSMLNASVVRLYLF